MKKAKSKSSKRTGIVASIGGTSEVPPPPPPPPPPPTGAAATPDRLQSAGLKKNEKPLPDINKKGTLTARLAMPPSTEKTSNSPKLNQWLTDDKLLQGKYNLKSPGSKTAALKVDREVLFDAHEVFSYFPLEKLDATIRNSANAGSINLIGVDQVTDMVFIYMNHLCRDSYFARYVGSLNLGGCHHLTDLGVHFIIQTFPNLVNITLTGCNKITNDGLSEMMMKITSLQTIKMDGTDVSFVVPIPTSRSNVRVNYNGCPVISPGIATSKTTESFSRHQYFCDLIETRAYGTHKVIVCRNSTLKTSLMDLIGPKGKIAGNPVQTCLERKTASDAVFNILECPPAMTPAFSTSRTIFAVTFSVDEDINKSVPNVSSAILDILRQNPRAVFCLIGVTETGSPVCTTEKLRDLLMEELVRNKTSQLDSLGRTVEDVFQHLSTDGRLLDFAMQEELANVWRLKLALQNRLTNRIFTCTVDSNKQSEAGVAVDDCLSDAAVMNNEQNPTYEHMPFDLMNDLLEVPSVKEVQETDFVAKQLRTKLKEKYGTALRPYVKMLELMALLGKAILFTAAHKSYVVTDLEWFAEFLSVVITASTKSSDHHIKYLHPDTPTLHVDDLTDKLKFLFTSEAKILSTVKNVLSAFNLGWQHDKDIILACGVKSEPPVPLDPLLRENTNDPAISVTFACHQPISKGVINFFMNHVTQDVRPLLLWDHGVFIQMAPFQVSIKFEGQVPNKHLVNRVTLCATVFCGKASGKQLKAIYEKLEERVAYYRLVLEYTFKQWNVSYTYGKDSDLEYKPKMVNIDEKWYNKGIVKIPNHHNVLPSKRKEHEGKLMCKDCGTEETAMLNHWMMENTVRPCFTGKTWSPLSKNKNVMQKGNWFAFTPGGNLENGFKWEVPLLAESFSTLRMIIDLGRACVSVRVGNTEYKMVAEKDKSVLMMRDDKTTLIEDNKLPELFERGKTLEVRVMQRPKAPVSKKETQGRDAEELISTPDPDQETNDNDLESASRQFAEQAKKLRKQLRKDAEGDQSMTIHLEFICGGEVVWNVDTDWKYTSTSDVSFSVYSTQQLNCFLDVSSCVKPVVKPQWKVGMRLEAKDRLNPSLICVANVVNVTQDGNTISINFDGWTSRYDYTTEVTSPDLHPVGYIAHLQRTHARGKLEAPKGYRSNFDWNVYLDEIGQEPVPHELFSEEQTEGAPEFGSENSSSSRFMSSKLIHCSNAGQIKEVYHKFHDMEEVLTPDMVLAKLTEFAVPLVILLPSSLTETDLTYHKISHQDNQKIYFMCLNNGYVHIVNMEGIHDAQLIDRLTENWSFCGLCLMMMRMQEHFLPADVQKIVNSASISAQKLEEMLREEFIKLLVTSMMTTETADTPSANTFTEICQGVLDLATKTMNFPEMMVKVDEQYWCSDHMRLGPETQLATLDLTAIQNVQHLTTELDLRKNQLTELPADMFTSLPKLSKLNLAENRINQLPSFKGASNLSELDVSKNCLKTFPDDLDKHSSGITKLNISRNPLKEIPECVLKCVEMKTLLVKDLGLPVIPKGLAKMKALEVLDISGHTLTQIPAEICKLKNLIDLDISGIAWFSEYDNARSVLSRQAFDDAMASNTITAGLSDKERSTLFNGEDGGQKSTLDYKGITRLNTALYASLPRLGQDSKAEGGTEESQKEAEALLEPLFKLKKLVSLRMKYLAIREIPAAVGQLANLEVLDVSHCPSLGAISSEVVICKLTSLNVKDCGSLKTPPKEIVRRGFAAVMGYLKRLQMGSVTCKRTKLMMVGLGGAGKTSTIKAMMSRRQRYDGDLHVTDGIDIMSWDVCYDKSTKEDNTITYSVWDFAGQTVYYNTHQFFLSNRAVYLLMWNVRLGHEHAGLDFWLSSIACHAPKAPVLVIGTHIDQVEKFWLPEEALKKRFPQIVAFHSVSSYTGTGIDALAQEIYYVALKEKYMGEKIPQVWLKFEENIAKVGKGTEKKDLLEWSEVSKLAEDVGIVDELELKQATRFLHDLGSLQHFENDSLKSKVVINPQWIVNVMSCVVSVHENAIQDGKLKHTDLDKIWSDYPADLHKWLLRLTEEFDLTFPLLAEPANLVACLLPDKEPEFTWQDVSEIPGQHETKMLYKFEYLPAGLFNRAQVRLSQFSDSAIIWKRGSLLHKTGHRALMKQLPGSEVEVKVQGPCPDNFLFLVHEVFETLIIEAYNGVTYDFLVPCSDCIRVGTYDPCMFEASKIRRAVELKVPFLQCDKYFHTLSLTEVQASMPPDSSTDFDAHLERNLRDLKDLRSDMETDVFLFYCGADVPGIGEDDAKIAPRKIYQDLVDEGFKVWFTADPNSVDLKSIALTMKNAKLVVVLLSDQFVQDDQCCNVFYYAQHTLHKRLQTIVIGGNQWQKTDIGLQMAAEVFIKMDNPKRYKHKKVELMEAVTSKTAKKKVTHPECFISYCWSNSKDAINKGSRKIEGALGWGDPREFKKHLEEKGIACWMDIERVGQGGLFEDIAEGLRHAKIVVACVSDEYAKSKNCQMELRFATSILKLPLVVVIVGTGYAWEATEVGMLTLGFPKINAQYESTTVLERLVTGVKAALPKEGKKEDKEEEEPKNAQHQAYQELLELAQRKFLRQVAGYASSSDIGSYPRLFFLDFVTKDDKDASGRPLLSEKETKEETNKHIVRILCECEQGWHVPGRGYLVPTMASAEMEEFLIRMAPYGARVMGILRHTALDYPVLNTERGDKLRAVLEENCLVDKDFKDEYTQCQQFLIGLDEDQSMGGLTQCHMPNGKVLWLCQEHISVDERISTMDNAGAVVDQATTIDLSQSQDKGKLSKLRGKLKGAQAAALIAGSMNTAHQSSKTCSVM